MAENTNNTNDDSCLTYDRVKRDSGLDEHPMGSEYIMAIVLMKLMARCDQQPKVKYTVHDLPDGDMYVTFVVTHDMHYDDPYHTKHTIHLCSDEDKVNEFELELWELEVNHE